MKNEIRTSSKRARAVTGGVGRGARRLAQTIKAIETERYTPSLLLAMALARFFGRPLEEVFDEPGDEYWERIDVHASYLAGLATIGLIIGLCLWEWAHGRSGTPYVQLGSISGVAYVAALALLRVRS